jgi:hypothetical protein
MASITSSKIWYSIFNIHYSLFNTQHSVCSSWCSLFHISYFRFLIPCSTFNIEYSIFNTQYSVFIIEDSTINIRDWRFKIQDSLNHSPILSSTIIFKFWEWVIHSEKLTNSNLEMNWFRNVECSIKSFWLLIADPWLIVDD